MDFQVHKRDVGILFFMECGACLILSNALL